MAPDLRERFTETFEKYNQQTMICSVSRQMRRQPAYQEVLDLGPGIIPFLLQALGEDEWGISTQILLHDLTGADPSSAAREQIGDTGMVGINVAASAELWRRWGREQGYDFS